jgi:surface polysaccharide O-acyltransferase-like enzyme
MVSVSARAAHIRASTRAVHFATLDGLRAVAAIAVVMLHSTLLLSHRLSCPVSSLGPVMSIASVYWIITWGKPIVAVGYVLRA